jgi:hypothetical protein
MSGNRIQGSKKEKKNINRNIYRRKDKAIGKTIKYLKVMQSNTENTLNLCVQIRIKGTHNRQK